MADLTELDQEIEGLRKNLEKLAKEKEYCFLDKEVRRLSERLDMLIVQRERCRIKGS